MLASDVSPMAMVFVAVCGGSQSPYPNDPPTSTGIRCSDYQLMIDVEIDIANDCSFDSECDQVIPVDATCATANRLVNIDYDLEHLFSVMEEAEGVGCTIDYGARGDCDSGAEAVCASGSCRWR